MLSIEPDFAFWLYDSAGAVIGQLRDVQEFDLSTTLNGTSTLSLKYPAGGVLAEYLDVNTGTNSLCEIGLSVTSGGGYASGISEPHQVGRFIVESATHNLLPTVGYADMLDVKLVSNASRLDDAVVRPPQTTTTENKGHRVFSGVTPDVLMKTLWEEAASRGWGKDLNRGGWGSGADSTSTTFASVVDMSIAGGTTLRRVLDDLVSRGVLEWELTGRTLYLYNAYGDEMGNGLAEDLTQGSKALLLPLSDLASDAKDTFDWSNRASSVIIEGEDGKTWRVENGIQQAYASSAVWDNRAREKYVKVQGVDNYPAAVTAAQPYLLEGRTRSETVHRTYALRGLGRTPLFDFNVGAWVNVEREYFNITQRVPMRITEMKVSWTMGQDALVDLTLGTREQSLLEKMHRLATSSVNGVTVSSTAGAATYVPKDKSVPVPAKAGVPTASLTMDDRGINRLTLIAQAVTTDTKGNSLTSGGQMGYEFQYQYGTTASDVSSWQSLASTLDRTATITELIPGYWYGYRVRAQWWPDDNDGGWPSNGAWSDARYIQSRRDTTAPPVPSAPVVSSKFLAMQVTWDGQTATATDMPGDFDHLGIAIVSEGAVLRETHATGTPDQKSIAVAGFTASTYDVAIRAYDTWGNASDWSQRVTVEVSATVDASSIQAAVDAALSPLEDSIGKAIELSNAVANISNQVMVEGETPPSDGIVGMSYWKAPDAKWYKLVYAPPVYEGD